MDGGVENSSDEDGLALGWTATGGGWGLEGGARVVGGVGDGEGRGGTVELNPATGSGECSGGIV